MKSKSAFRLVRNGSPAAYLLAAATAAMLGTHFSSAADFYWDGSGSPTTGWEDFGNWSDDAGGTPSVGTPALLDNAYFSIASINSAQTVNLNAGQAAKGLVFLATNTAQTDLLGGSGDQILTLGANGITVNTLAGPVTIGSATPGQNVAISLGAAQVWANDSLSALTIENSVSNGANLLTVTGAGDTLINGVIGNGAGGLTKTGAGVLTLNNTNNYSGQTTVTLGTLNAAATNALGTGALLVNGGTLAIGAINNTVGAVTLTSGSITGTSGLLTGTSFAVASGSASAILDGAAALTKTTAGTVTLSGANSYTGLTTISQGALRISDASGLGTIAAGTTVSASGAALQLNGAGVTYNNEALTLNGTGISTGGALQNVSGDNTWQGAITLNSASAIGSDSGTLTISGGISGAFPLTFAGAGNIKISTTALNANITPITKIGSGGLTIDVASTLVTAPISVNNGTFTLGGAGVLGNVAGTISVATLRANRTDQDLTSGTLPAGFQVGSFVLGQMVERVSGTSLNISGGPNTATTGLVPYTSGVQALGGGSLVLDNSGTNVPNRFGGRAVGLGSSSSLTLTPSTSGAVSESIGGLVLMMGESTITLNADAGYQTDVVAASLASRFVGNTALIRGSNLGSAAGNGISTFTLTAAPTFIGSTTASGTDKGILPWVIVDSSATGLGTSFATTSGAGQILRPLNTSTEMVTDIYTGGKNVLLIGSQPTITADTSINSLTIDSGNVTITDPAFAAARRVLTITSGGLLSKTAASSISGGILSWGNGQLDVFTPAATAGANILTVSSRVSGQGLVKAGGGTLVLSSTSPAYPTFSQNTISGGLGIHNGSVYINEGVVQLNAHNAIGSGAVGGGTNNSNLLNVAYGGTLDLNGKSQFTGPVTSQLFLQNTGENLLDVRGGIITSSTPASLVAYVGNPGGGAPGPFSFGGSITGSVGFALGGEGTWAQQLTGANSYTGPTVVYNNVSTGGLILKDGGTLSGTSRVDTNFGATFMIDNTGLADNADRINDAAAIGMNGGSLTYKGRAQTNSTEILGAVTAAMGLSTITVTPGGTNVNSADLTMASLDGTGGGTINFIPSGGIGYFGASTTNSSTQHINISGATPASLTTAGVMVNGIIPFAITQVPGSYEFVSYIPYTTVNGVTSGGLGALGSTGYAAYTNAAPTNVNAPTANYKNGAFTITGDVNINSLFLSGSSSNVTFTTGTDVLNLTSGALFAYGQNAIGTTVDSGRLTAGDIASSGIVNLYTYWQDRSYTINSRIIDNPNLAQVRFVGNNGITLSNPNNSYTGGTILNGGTSTLNATSAGFTVPNATTPADGLIINGATVNMTNTAGQIGSGNIVTLSGNSTLNLFGNNTLAGLAINHLGQGAPVINTTPSAFAANTTSPNITLTLTGGITSTTNNMRGVSQINGRVSLPASPTLDIGAATFNGLVLNPIQADLIVTGLTGGGGTITKSGSGTLQFNQPTTITGTLDVTVGGIQVGNVANAGARFANVTLQNGTWLNLAGQDGLFGSLAAPGTGVVTNSGGLKTLTVGFSDASTTFAGSFQRFNDSTLNLINLQKIGTGTMTMTGNTSTASGTLTINSTGGGGVTFLDSGVNNFVQNAITVNAGGTLTLDDSGTTNLSNRLTNAGVTLSGGSFVSTAAAAGSTETTTGNLTLNTGESTVTLNQGAASNVTTFANLTFGAGGTGTFGGAGIGTAVNKVMLTSAPGLTGYILPRLAVGTEFATYNQDGLGVANTDGVQAISAAASSSPADINAAAFSANLKVTPAVTTRNLTAARTVNSLNIADNSVDIGTNGSLLPTQGLLISTGGVIVNGTGAVISTPVTTMNVEGIFRVNSGQDLTVNSRIGASQPLTKTGSGDMTIGRLADYIGTTTVNQGLLKFGTGIGSNPLQVSVTTGAPTVQMLQMNGGTLDLNGNKLLVGTINGSNIYTGGTITNTAGGSAVTLTSLSGGGTFGGQITGNLNFTLAGNSDFRGAVTTLKDAQSYSGATIIRSGGLTLQDKGALYAGVGDLTNASVTLNNAMLVFDNANLSTTAAGPTRIPSTVPITLKAGTIAVKPGASADTTTSLGTVTVGGYYNNILSNLTVNQGGISLSNTLGGTNTLTIGNLTTSNTGGIVSFGKYSNQNGGLVDSQAQRVFVTQVNGNTVTAGSGWSNGATGMLPAWAMIAANASGTGNATGLGDFATLSSTGFGIVAYGDTNFGAPAYLTGTIAGVNFSTGSVTSIGAGTMAAGNYLTGALKATGGLSFTAATDTLNIESGGFSAGGTIGSAQNNGQLTAGGLLPTTGSTVDLYVYNSGTLNSKVIDNPNNGGAKVRLIIANVNSITAINGNNSHTGGTVIMGGREGQYAATLGTGGVIIPAGGLTLVSNLNNSSPARFLTAPTGSIDPANDVTLAGGNVQLTMTGTNTLASLIFDDGGEGVANPVVNTATNLILSKTTAQGSAINSKNDNIGGGIPTVAGTLLTLQDGATITTSGEAPVSLSITAPLTTTAATLPLHKDGSGSLIITGTNTYANGWNLDAGTLILSSTANAGIGTGKLTIANGTALMGAAAVSIGNLVDVANDASFTFGTLDATNARANATNNVTLTNTVTLGTGAHAINVNGLLMTGTISGQLTGGTNLTKSGPGTLLLNNATNNFGGTVSINGGTLRDGVVGAIPSGRIMNVAADAAFDMNAISQSVDSLNGAGSVINPGGAAVLTINGTTDGSFSGTLAATTAANLSLVKDGANTQTLSGTNPYGGTTAVNGGTLLINGANTGTGTVTVGASGTLGGTGTIAGAVNVTGILAPGASIETLGSGTLTLDNLSTLACEVKSGVSPTVGADLLKVTGGLNLNGTVTLSLTDIASSPTAFTSGTIFSLINYSGAWNNGLLTYGVALNDGDTFSAGLNTWTIDYDAATGGSNFSTEYAGGSDSFVNISIAGVALTPYETWAGIMNLTSGNKAPELDPDNDGATNLAEFAFNGDPLDGSDRGMFYNEAKDNGDVDSLKELTFTCAVRRSAGINFTADGNNAQVSTAPIDGVTYTIEGSTTLTGAWNSVVSYISKSDAPPAGSTLSSLAGTDWEYRTFSAFDGMADKGFLRTKTEGP